MRRIADPSARLLLLRDARAKVGRKKQLLNADEMAAVVGMTWRHLKPKVEEDPQFPVERRGSEGVAWLFDAGKTLGHMIKRLEAKERQRNAHSERIAKMAGIAPEVVSSGITVADLAKIDQIQTSVQKRKIEQRSLVRKDRTEEVIAGMFGLIQQETLATVSRLDPAGRWPAPIRADVADAMRSLLVRLHDSLEEWLTDDVRPAGATGRRTRSTRV